MDRLKFMWVDAFTDQIFRGNPCAVVFGADDLTTEEMLTLAREFNLSETAFVLNSERADFGARYFAPSEDILLAGHPTISTVHSLIRTQQISKDTQRLTLELPAGVIEVEIVDKNNQTFITMNQLKPLFMSYHEPENIAKMFNLKPGDLIPTRP